MDVKITFTKDYQVNDDEGTEFKKGAEHSMNEASANRYIRRCVAVLSVECQKPKTDKQKTKKGKKNR